VTQELWDAEAASFDDAPDHGLADPVVRAAWRELLLGVLPAAPARIADLGCGTGTLSRLLVDEGYALDGLDISPEMIRRAKAKVPEAEFSVGDAAAPGFTPAAYDVVLCRHVLWAMPDPVAAVTTWTELLAPDGVVVLVEGRWSNGVGLSAIETEAIVRAVRSEATVRHLTEDVYWGTTITDERYLVTSLR